MLTVDLFVPGGEGACFPVVYSYHSWQNDSIGPHLGMSWYLTAVDSLPGYGFAGLFQSANVSHTIMALEINLGKSDSGAPSVTEARVDRQGVQ